MLPLTLRKLESDDEARRGAFMVIALLSLIVAFGFTALAIDVGMLAVEKTKMQNAVDAASMAAVMELTAAIEEAGPEIEDVTAFAMDAAKQEAAKVDLCIKHLQ